MVLACVLVPLLCHARLHACWLGSARVSAEWCLIAVCVMSWRVMLQAIGRVRAHGKWLCGGCVCRAGSMLVVWRFESQCCTCYGRGVCCAASMLVYAVCERVV